MSNTVSNTVTCLIYYIESGGLKCGTKDRVNVPFDFGKKDAKGQHFYLVDFINHISQYAGIIEQAKKRGLGDSVDRQVARVHKCGGQRMCFAIPTQMAFEVEKIGG